MTKRLKGKTEKDKAKSELVKAHALKKRAWGSKMHPLNPIKWHAASKADERFGGGLRSIEEKWEKKYPKLVKDLKYERSKFVNTWEEGPKKVKPNPKATKKVYANAYKKKNT